MVVHLYNSSTWKAKAGRLKVQGQPGLHSKTCFKKLQKIENVVTPLSNKSNAKPFPCENVLL
jgi:hypothetical protein